MGEKKETDRQGGGERERELTAAQLPILTGLLTWEEKTELSYSAHAALSEDWLLSDRTSVIALKMLTILRFFVVVVFGKQTYLEKRSSGVPHILSSH